MAVCFVCYSCHPCRPFWWTSPLCLMQMYANISILYIFGFPSPEEFTNFCITLWHFHSSFGVSSPTPVRHFRGPVLFVEVATSCRAWWRDLRRTCRRHGAKTSPTAELFAGVWAAQGVAGAEACTERSQWPEKKYGGVAQPQSFA